MAVVVLLELTSTERQNMIFKSQVSDSKKDNNLYTGEEEDVELVGWVCLLEDDGFC